MVEERIALLRNFLIYCFKDHKLSKEEIDSLNKLKKILRLTDPQIRRAKDEAGRELFKKAFEEAIADKTINDEERRFLAELERRLGLERKVREKIQAESSEVLIRELFNDIVRDKRISDEEDAALTELAKNLAVDLTFEPKTKALYDRFRLYWKIENGQMDPIKSQINLFKGENCYFETNCEWYEYRSVTKRINYAGPTYRLRLAKGLYYRVGSMKVQPIRDEELRLIDRGKPFLTDRRIIFMGSRNNRSMRLNSILDFQSYNNGVELMRSTGKNPFLGFPDQSDIFSLLLARLMEEY
jgi:hypothetical protein